MPVRIVTDSSCDLPQELADELGIEIVPLKIRFGDEEFVDRKELSTDDFWRRSAASSVLPETAAPPPGAFEEVFRRLAAEGAEGIVSINLSSELSATMQSAEIAARAVSDVVPVRVVDSRSITMGLGMMCVEAARTAAQGKGLDDVAGVAEDLSTRTKVYGALDTLDNLRKGGRIGGAQAFFGSLLSIKPIIEVSNGVVEPEAKQRTRAKALAYLIDKVKAEPVVENLAVMHADCPDVGEFVERLRPYYEGEIIVGQIGPVIGTHGGRGTIGVVYQAQPAR
jgi:DegV family protein with EDD domain